MTELTASRLKKTQGIVNGDANFRHLGSIDVKMGIKVGKAMYLITFAAFTCHAVRKITAKEVREADFVIEMSSGQWRQFMAGCRSGDGSSLAQLDSTQYVVKATDPRRKLDFLRYHTSIQAFFEAYATLEPAAA